ncbi:serine kinase [Gracilibacillus boraciitolerans JCM 21714]|uniref:Serine kinase n=1 Tax=Gracilibacillus boraciitolerans JCM 21714 TaxID=1298598 RepID=W4VPT6_9BACI|nr:aldolase [Gracilibacillus boraciitolerans]GAE94769.1 serine kinase [Gracilibacillus boraciitolerans JCM 21714]
MWDEFEETTSHFVVKEQRVLFHVPDTAIFMMEHGSKITVSPIDDNKADNLRLYLLGTCMGVLLMQRRIIPLHGSAIEIEGRAYAIVGHSGAGKSTLASAFMERGYRLLSDDVIPITFSDEDKPIVTPSYPHQKLWTQTLEHFGRDTSGLKPIIFRDTKFGVPVTNQFCFEKLPLAGVFEVTKTLDDHIQINPVEKLQQFYLLYKHTYRNFLIKRAGLMEWHFQTVTKISNSIDFYQLERPSNRFTAEELTDVLLTTINKEEWIDEQSREILN